MAPIISSFLARDYNEDSVEITGKRVNHELDMALSHLVFYGPNKYLECLENIFSSQSLIPKS